jgi:hypothetical protein
VPGCLMQSGARLNRVELNGALLNRPDLERLGSAASIAVVARVRRELPAQVHVTLERRAGAVKSAVVKALAGGGRPMRVTEIQREAERLAGEPLSANTVKDYLHKTARQPHGPVERVGYGRYVLSPCREETWPPSI